MKALLFLLTISLLSCSSITVGKPGAFVTDGFAERWGCNKTAVKEQARIYNADLPRRKFYIPQPGWTACEVLAHIGAPQNYEYSMSSDITGAWWWYQSGYETKGIYLVISNDTWLVEHVSW